MYDFRYYDYLLKIMKITAARMCREQLRHIFIRQIDTTFSDKKFFTNNQMVSISILKKLKFIKEWQQLQPLKNVLLTF